LRRPVFHERQRLQHCAAHSLNNLFQQRWLDYSSLRRHARALHLQDQHQYYQGGLWLGRNPYMSAVPFMGNFDVAVLVRALHESGRGRVSCHVATVSGVRALHLHQEKDSEEDQGDQGEEDQEDQGEDQGEEELRRVGFIVNTQVASCVPLTSPSRHWFAVWRDPGTGAGGVHAHAHAETQPCLHTPAPPSPSPVYWNLDSKLSQPESFRSCDELRTFLCELVQHHAAQVFEVVAPG
jgi:hypothetical protein